MLSDPDPVSGREAETAQEDAYTDSQRPESQPSEGGHDKADKAVVKRSGAGNPASLTEVLIRVRPEDPSGRPHPGKVSGGPPPKLRVTLGADASWGQGLSEDTDSGAAGLSAQNFPAPGAQPVAQSVASEPPPQEAEEVASPPAAVPVQGRSMREICTDIVLSDPRVPPDVAREEFARYGPPLDGTCVHRGWDARVYQWESFGLLHQPLYFEEVNLERYGYTRCAGLRPVVSAAHFFTTVPILPYKMTVQPCREPVYTLGYYRPGSCAPNRRHRLPWSVKAGLVEGAVVTGLVFAIP